MKTHRRYGENCSHINHQDNIQPNKQQTWIRIPRNVDESFEKCLSNHRREDKSIWKPMKNRRNPKATLPPIRIQSTPLWQWANTDNEKAELFAEHYNRPTSWYVVFFSLARSTPVTSRSPVLILVTAIIIVIQINRTGY